MMSKQTFDPQANYITFNRNDFRIAKIERADHHDQMVKALTTGKMERIFYWFYTQFKWGKGNTLYKERRSTTSMLRHGMDFEMTVYFNNKEEENFRLYWATLILVMETCKAYKIDWKQHPQLRKMLDDHQLEILQPHWSTKLLNEVYGEEKAVEA